MAKTAWLGAAKPVGQVPQNGTAPSAPAVATSRSRLRSVGAAALVVIGVAAGLLVYQRSAQRTPVLVIGQAMTQGQVIQASDLSVVQITPTSGLSLVGADSEAQVIGHHAAMPLAAGQLLVPADLAATGTTLATGQVEIGAALGPTQLPAEGVSVGQKVDAVESPTAAGADKTNAGGILTQATVMAVSHPGSGGSAAELVSLSVPEAQAQAVEAAAATSSLGVVPVPTPRK